ncbi:competence-related pilin export protein ComGB [Bacillus oleivorans]|uniref:Competence-related pilin export protein ComGB n=1 Tax=Bacillus oleivorans TaxID=1448271 RepID=A0A285CK25_9BACI|nr:competence type IV pilus assembly protein ComGB [Bacillus oleivorans]SNX67937.1 competence-related pilin export protein ComGB [Bacillus oleivorans]
MNKKWSVKEQIHFFKRLGELLQAGYHIQEALLFLKMTDFLSKKTDWGEAISELKSGKHLFSILRDWRFESDLVIFVMIAEKHGNIGEALIKGSQFLEQLNSHKEKIKKMMVYPFVLLVISAGLFIITCIWLLPQFESMFSQSSVKSPWTLKFLLFFKNDLPDLSLWLLLISLLNVICYALITQWVSATKRHLFWSVIPIVGPIVKLYHSCFFSYQWSILLQKGLSYLECVAFMKEWEDKPFYQEMSIRMKQSLSKGESLSDTVREERIFLKELPHLIEHGQKNGRMEREFLSFSLICSETLEKKMLTFSKLIQPICFLCIGVVVVLLYVSVMFPVIQMLEGIK